MKGKKFLMLMLSILLSLCGCNIRSERLSDAEIEKTADDFARSVVDIINSRDEEKLKVLFTDEAIQSPDFNKGKEYLFEVYKGELVSAEKLSIAFGGTINKYGHSYKPHMIYRIVTDKETYLLYIQYYVKGYTDEGKQYSNKILRLRLAIESELPETGAFSGSGGLGGKLGIYHPNIDTAE